MLKSIDVCIKNKSAIHHINIHDLQIYRYKILDILNIRILSIHSEVSIKPFLAY